MFKVNVGFACLLLLLVFLHTTSVSGGGCISCLSKPNQTRALRHDNRVIDVYLEQVFKPPEPGFCANCCSLLFKCALFAFINIFAVILFIQEFFLKKIYRQMSKSTATDVVTEKTESTAWSTIITTTTTTTEPPLEYFEVFDELQHILKDNLFYFLAEIILIQVLIVVCVWTLTTRRSRIHDSSRSVSKLASRFSRLSSRFVSRFTSKSPSRMRTRLPSRVSFRMPSRVPTRSVSMLPSCFPKGFPSQSPSQNAEPNKSRMSNLSNQKRPKTRKKN